MIAITFLLFFGVVASPSLLVAQAHPGFENLNLSSKDEAELFFAKGHYKKSLEKFKEVLESEGETSYVFRTMLKAWKALDGLADAEEFLLNYKMSHNESSHTWYAWGFLNYLKNNFPQAEKDFDRALKLNPENGLAWNNWGAILSEKKQYSAAVKKVKMAIEANPNEPIFLWNLQKIYQEMGEPQRFKIEYENLLAQGSKKLVWAYGKTLVRTIRQRAFSSYSKGDLENAVSGFEEMLKIYREMGDIKGQVPALFSLGLLYEEKGDAPKAQNFFEKVLAINPDHIQAKEKIKDVN